MKKILKYLINLWYNRNKDKKKDCVIMNKYNINEIVKWLLSKNEMTHKRLQKLLYFSYGEYLAIKNENKENIKIALFNNDFEGWAHGPVSPKIYNIFKGSGYKTLGLHPNSSINIDDEDNIILNGIYNKYKEYTTDELEKISHEQAPWKNSRIGLGTFDIGNKRITTEDIFECFKNGASN